MKTMLTAMIIMKMISVITTTATSTCLLVGGPATDAAKPGGLAASKSKRRSSTRPHMRNMKVAKTVGSGGAIYSGRSRHLSDGGAGGDATRSNSMTKFRSKRSHSYGR